MKALDSLLCEVYARSTHRDRVAESKFTGTIDEETIILTLIAMNLVDVGYGLSIYSKIIASGADTYRERACQVVCAVVVAQQAPVSLSLMTHAVEIFVKLLKNDDNKQPSCPDCRRSIESADITKVGWHTGGVSGACFSL